MRGEDVQRERARGRDPKTIKDTSVKLNKGILPNLAIEGIFTFLFGTRLLRWGHKSKDVFDGLKAREEAASAVVESFCIMRSINISFWDRSYEFVMCPPEEEEFKFSENQNVPPWTILKESRVNKIHLSTLKDIGEIDISSLRYVKGLRLRHIQGRFLLTAPPNLEKLHLHFSNLDLDDLVDVLKQTKLIRLNIYEFSYRGRLDLSSLPYVKDLWLGDIFDDFSLTPPPNLEKFYIYFSKVDMDDMIQGLKETKLTRLGMMFLRYVNSLDLSSLLSVKDLRLGKIEDIFDLSPPPNVESLVLYGSKIPFYTVIPSLVETYIRRLEITELTVIGNLDLSALLYLTDLMLEYIDETFLLWPPPYLEILRINGTCINTVRLINCLEETDIIGLEIRDVAIIHKLDISSLLSLTNLVVGKVGDNFELTPSPYLENLYINSSTNLSTTHLLATEDW